MENEGDLMDFDGYYRITTECCMNLLEEITNITSVNDQFYHCVPKRRKSKITYI